MNGDQVMNNSRFTSGNSQLTHQPEVGISREMNSFGKLNNPRLMNNFILPDIESGGAAGQIVTRSEIDTNQFLDNNESLESRQQHQVCRQQLTY